MRSFLFALSLAAGLLLTASAGAQAQADFSGRWVIPAAGGAATGRGGAGAGAGQVGAGAAQRGGGSGARGNRASELGSGWGSDITIVQTATQLTLTYAFFGRGDMQPPIKFIFTLDGKESKNTVMMGRGMQEQLSKSAWEGEKLVITTLQNMPNPAGSGPDVKTETRQVLSLESPTVLLVETTRAGVLGGAPMTAQTRYNKI